MTAYVNATSQPYMWYHLFWLVRCVYTTWCKRNLFQMCTGRWSFLTAYNNMGSVTQKRSLMAWVIVIPKEGWVRVTFREYNLWCQQSQILKSQCHTKRRMGAAMHTQANRDLFACQSPYIVAVSIQAKLKLTVLCLPTGHKTFDQHCHNVSHQCWITVEI